LDTTVVITTRNRREELRTALRSAFSQSVPIEVLVLDDGSTDGTSEMVSSEFPQARLYSFRESSGYIVRRNEAARLASSEIIVSIDDDAEFSSRHVVEKTLREFDHPRIAAVAVPFRNVPQDETDHQRSPLPGVRFVTDSFIGTAHAVRRDVFLSMGGYREELVHQGEEKDLCIRLLNAGYVVRLGSSDRTNHYESPVRDFARMDYYGRRNDVLFAWQNVPMPYLPLHLTATILKGALYAVTRARYPMKMFTGLLGGLGEIVRGQAPRAPVTRATYRLHRRLKTRPMMPLAAIETQLARPRTCP
jgi:glycosyltransferase involved in cell wall biosynthesis